jgi:hypothetical protein
MTMRKILIAALIAAPLGGFAYQAFAKDAAPVLGTTITAADDMGLDVVAKKVKSPLSIFQGEGNESGEAIGDEGAGHEGGESGLDD